MKRVLGRVLTVAFPLMVAIACGPARQVEVPAETGVELAAAKPRQTGPAIEVRYSVMADVLNLVEGVSLWRQGMPRAAFRAFDDTFGLDDADRKLLKKFAFARSELEERALKGTAAPTFEAPFGPEGFFPTAAAGLIARFWEGVMSAGQPAAVARSLPGILDPSDAEAVAAVLGRLAPRAGELITRREGYRNETESLRQLLAGEPLGELLLAMGRFVGVDASKLQFQVHPVWAPESADFEAVAHGDRILVNLPEGKPVETVQAALVVHEIGRRLLSRMPAGEKALCTIRFVEKAGYRGEPFSLVEGLLDALSHGLAAPLMASGPEELPPWPGDSQRKKFAEALTPLLRKQLKEGRRLDGLFALQAAQLHFEINPPRPSDFLAGAMVIAEDRAVEPFKSQVFHWMVWKFPPSLSYNYPRKLEQNPGRSVLLLLAPAELEALPARLAGMDHLVAALREASRLVAKKQAVMIALPRQSRGYFFVLSASSPEKMKQLAKAFFTLDKIPTEPVSID